jgi:hypothetical protein
LACSCFSLHMLYNLLLLESEFAMTEAGSLSRWIQLYVQQKWRVNSTVEQFKNTKLRSNRIPNQKSFCLFLAQAILNFGLLSIQCLKFLFLRCVVCHSRLIITWCGKHTLTSRRVCKKWTYGFSGDFWNCL